MEKKTKDFDLTKIHLKDLEEKTEEYVDQIFVEPVKSLLAKNIICKTVKVVDTTQKGVANQKQNTQSVAIITIPFHGQGCMRFSEENLKIFEEASKKHPEIFIDRWNEEKTDHYEYVIAISISSNDTLEEVTQKLIKACSVFQIQEMKVKGISEEEDLRFKESISLEKLFPELDWGGHYELHGRERVWVANQENNLTDEQIRERILKTLDIAEDRKVDKNNQLWDKYYYEKHKNYLKEQDKINNAESEEIQTL